MPKNKLKRPRRRDTILKSSALFITYVCFKNEFENEEKEKMGEKLGEANYSHSIVAGGFEEMS